MKPVSGWERGGRWWHCTAVIVAAFGLIVQLILVIAGTSVLVPEARPELVTRLVRFFSYFTVQSNILVLATALTLALNPLRNGTVWSVLRLNAVVGIAVTGVIHWFFLRPLLHLTGWAYATDKILHVAVPLIAVIGWLVFGPRPRIGARTIWWSLLWPVAWLIYTLILGAATGWYPYPFIDVSQLGYGRTLINALGVTIVLLAISLLCWLGDRKLPARERDFLRSSDAASNHSDDQQL